jgi:hypothetical protein
MDVYWIRGVYDDDIKLIIKDDKHYCLHNL